MTACCIILTVLFARDRKGARSLTRLWPSLIV